MGPLFILGGVGFLVCDWGGPARGTSMYMGGARPVIIVNCEFACDIMRGIMWDIVVDNYMWCMCLLHRLFIHLIPLLFYMFAPLDNPYRKCVLKL